tara:strand:+ start:560 stop:739 length:180 start_codon:yes stop_codon:yes gene_type:complete
MTEKKEVVVTDIKMSFDAMITFIIKWFFATIIAGIIIFLAISVVVLILGWVGLSLPEIL